MHDLRCKETELDLQTRDFVHGGRPSNSLGTRLRKTDATDLAFCDQLSKHPDRFFNGHCRIDTSTLVDIQVLFAVEHIQAFVDSAAKTCLIAFPGTLDGYDHFGRVLRILREVGVEKLKRTSSRRTVERATIPADGSIVNSCLHGCNSIHGRDWLWAPRKSWDQVSLEMLQRQRHAREVEDANPLTHQAEACDSDINAIESDHFRARFELYGSRSNVAINQADMVSSPASIYSSPAGTPPHPRKTDHLVSFLAWVMWKVYSAGAGITYTPIISVPCFRAPL